MRSLTHKEFIEKIQRLYNNEIIILGHYKTGRIPIKIKSVICGHEWYRTPYHLYSNRNCPICGLQNVYLAMQKSHEQFLREIEELHNEKIIILSKYKGANRKIKTKCTICGDEWLTTPHRLLFNGCLKCSYTIRAQKMTKSHRQFVEEFKKVSNNKIKVLLEYKNIKTHIKIYCLK